VESRILGREGHNCDAACGARPPAPAGSQEDFLGRVFEAVTHPFYVVNAADYRIEMANSATAIFGQVSQGSTCYALTHRLDSPCQGDEHPCPLEIVRRTREPAVAVHTHFSADGEARTYEVHGHPIYGADGSVVQMIEYSLDITSHKRMQQELERRNRDLTLLNRLGHELSATHGVQAIVEQVLHAIPDLLPGAGGAIWLRDDEHEGWLVCRGKLNMGSVTVPDELHLRPGEGIAGLVALQGETVIIAHTPDDVRSAAAHDLQMGVPVGSLLAVPLRVHSQTTGTVMVHSESTGAFGEREALLLETLAASAAAAIESAALQVQAEYHAVAAERRSRLARDLHDAVSQTLFSASVVAETLPRLWDRDPAAVRDGLGQLQSLTRGALAEMRSLLLELRPETLTKSDLDGLLHQLADAVVSRTGARVSVEVVGALTLPPDVKIAFYRIAQEALNNVVKHARATEIGITLHAQPNEVELAIRDNGRGFDGEGVVPGRLGMSILHERAESVGAVLEVVSQSGQGALVRAKWPRLPREGAGSDER
jgi:signal transduction histidine kinase